MSYIHRSWSSKRRRKACVATAGCYLLNDSFPGNLGTPLATPRTCQPGPGSLVLDQTDGQFSIVAGEFIAPPQGTPVWGDQDWYALQADGGGFDVLGDEALVLKFRGAWISDDSPLDCWFGLSLDVTPDTVANAEHTFYRAVAMGAGIRCTSGGSDTALALRDLWPGGLGYYFQTTIAIRAYTPGGLHWYPGAAGVYSYGAHFFYQDERETPAHHLLAWYRQLQSRTDPLYPSFSNLDTAIALDYVRIPCKEPDDLSDPLLTPGCMDTFTGASALAAHTPDYQCVAGGWIEHDGAWTVGGGVVSPDASAPAHAYHYGLRPDKWVECAITPGTNARSIGLTLRESADTANGHNLWVAYIQSGVAGNDTILSEVLDGVITARATADNDWVVDTTYNIRARMCSVQITVYVDYVERLHYATAWFNADATHHGLFASNHATAQFDNLLALPRGTGLTRIAFDSFTDPNGTSLDGHTMDEGGLTWIESVGNWDIQTNEAACDAVNQSTAYVESGVSDAWVSARLYLATTKWIGLAIRKSADTPGGRNEWLPQITQAAGTDAYLTEVIDGAHINRASADTDIFTFGTRYYMQVDADGQSITVYVDGVQTLQYLLATFNETATWHGLYCNEHTTHRFDQFRVTAKPELGEYDAAIDGI